MSISHLLEDFSRYETQPDGALFLSEDAKEEDSLAVFEEGYKAGWDDADAAQKDERGHVAADLSRNLRDLTFTYHEAYAALAGAMRPLIEQIVTAALPDIAHATLGPRIAQELSASVLDADAYGITVVVAPDNVDAVESLLEQSDPVAVTVRGDPSLGAGQAHLQLGERERQINLDEVLNGLAETVTGIFEDIEKRTHHA